MSSPHRRTLRGVVAAATAAALVSVVSLASAWGTNPGTATTDTGQAFHLNISGPADGADLPVGTTSTAVTGTVSLGNVPVSGEAHVAFVIDESGSLGTSNYNIEKQSAIGLFDQIRHTSGLSVNTSLFFFSTTSNAVETVLTDQPAADNFVTAVNSHPYAAGSTYTDDAIRAAQAQLTGKPGIKQIVLITDGAPNPVSQTPDQAHRNQLDSAGIAVYTYAVGSGGVCGPLAVISTKCTLVPQFTSLPDTLTGTPPAGVSGVDISVNGGAFAPVTSVDSLGQITATASGLHAGDNQIALRATATDTAHTTVSADVTVHVPFPGTTITAGPSGTVASSTASFSYTGVPAAATDHFVCTLDGSSVACNNGSQTLTGLPDGDHTFTVAAVDTAGNADPTPAERTWTVDTTAPDTTITGGPSHTVASGNADLTYTGDPAADTVAFACTLDGATVGCGDGSRSFTGLSDGPHTFTAAAVDAVGNTDATPASRSWTVDTTAPDTSITGGPLNTVASSTADFSYVGDPSGDTDHFVCTLDDSPAACGAGSQELTGLADGEHTFTVAAVDAVGNADATPARRTWTVDTTPPDTVITHGPAAVVATSSAVLTFTGVPASDTDHLVCTLDDQARACAGTSASLTGLADGPHTFTVAAVDAAGNVDPTPASHTWTVDTTPPNTKIDSGPVGTVASAVATLSYEGVPAADTDHFVCTLDDVTAPCPDPSVTLTGLADGPHTFSVAAVDTIGNIDPSPATRTWIVDTTPPDTKIDSGPTGTVASQVATLTYEGLPASDTDHFLCTLDSSPVVCGNGSKTLTGLTVGGHTFTAAAVDQAGNTDPTPASRSWNVDAPPVAALSPSPATVETHQTVTFSTAGTSDPDGMADLASWSLSYGDGGPTLSGSGAPPATFTHAYSTSGAYVASLAVTDRTGLTSTATANVTVNRAATTLKANALVATVRVSALLGGSGLAALISAQVPLQPSATLTRTRDGSPIAGRTVTFSTTAGATICSAVTDSQGRASCGGVLSVVPALLGLGYNASFAGDPSYQPSRGAGSLVVAYVVL